jgi:hypothetical protein
VNDIERAVEALEAAEKTLAEDWIVDSDPRRTLRAALVALRRYKVVEGCVGSGKMMTAPTEFWPDETPVEPDLFALLLVRAPETEEK